jgi:hypothetical protein
LRVIETDNFELLAVLSQQRRTESAARADDYDSFIVLPNRGHAQLRA